MRLLRQENKSLIRLMGKPGTGELAYIKFGLRGPKFTLEFPIECESPRGWLTVSLGFITASLSFPWPWTTTGEDLQSPPRYGFYVCDGAIRFMWGADRGREDDPHRTFRLPWDWRICNKTKLTENESHMFHYKDVDGTQKVQIATVSVYRFSYKRPWLLRRKTHNYINVHLEHEVGKGIGSWKGGFSDGSFRMLDTESSGDAIRRIEGMKNL